MGLSRPTEWLFGKHESYPGNLHAPPTKFNDTISMGLPTVGIARGVDFDASLNVWRDVPERKEEKK